MYIPKAHEEARIDVLHKLMRDHPLGSLVTFSDNGLVANHIPFLIDSMSGERGTLKGHVARTNPIWREAATNKEALVIFQGPQCYVSPNWYPTKHQTGKAVPTWNYAVVHAYGAPKFIDDPLWILNLISDLSNEHEASQQLPWKVSDAPKDFTNRLIEMIVGVEIPIARLEGKWKVSQNRPKADKLGVMAGLEMQEDEASKAIAVLVERALNG
jgi:transcriptional regulator